MRTRPAIRARALVRHHARRRRALAVGACRAVHARRRRAFLDVLARLASVVRLVARVAHALVGANADMDTLGVVLVTVVLRATAWIHFRPAENAGPFVRTGARKLGHAVRARRAVLARRRRAVVVVHLAVEAAVAARAHAAVRERMIEARAAVQARQRVALVQLSHARANRHIRVSRRTRAFVGVNHVLAASAVAARGRGAFVFVSLADRASVSSLARTEVVIGWYSFCNTRL